MCCSKWKEEIIIPHLAKLLYGSCCKSAATSLSTWDQASFCWCCCCSWCCWMWSRSPTPPPSPSLPFFAPPACSGHVCCCRELTSRPPVQVSNYRIISIEIMLIVMLVLMLPMLGWWGQLCIISSRHSAPSFVWRSAHSEFSGNIRLKGKPKGNLLCPNRDKITPRLRKANPFYSTHVLSRPFLNVKLSCLLTKWRAYVSQFCNALIQDKENGFIINCDISWVQLDLQRHDKPLQ